MEIKRFVRPVVAVLGLSVMAAGCADAPQSTDQNAAQPPDSEQQVAVVAPAVAPALYREVAEAPALRIVDGERLDFDRSLTPQQQRMVESHLAEALANSGGAAADVRVANVDLNGDGRDEAIVMIHSGPYCGAGDVCNFWMFEQKPSGWRQINGNDDAADTLYLLPGSTQGYRNIGIRGHCGAEVCDFLLAYNGRNYQWVNDPTPQPAG